MKRRYVLAPDAALDLIQIWRHLKNKASTEIANRVEAAIRGKIGFLARRPGSGHWRKDLTNEKVKFFPSYSYLIVYRPETNPLQVVAILHGHRDVGTPEGSPVDGRRSGIQGILPRSRWISQSSARNGHHEFEHLCFDFARNAKIRLR